MKNLVLFDFDGTMIEGDSTRLAYRSIYSSTFSFVLGYYLKHLLALMILVFTGSDYDLKESRRIQLASKFNVILNSDFIIEAQKRMFNQVYSRAINYVNNGYKLVIVSAGYSELIRLIIGENIEYELIANSLFDKEPVEINFEHKVTSLNLVIKSKYFVQAAYGNTEGDIPMLQLATKAYWVDEKGRIAEFRN